MTKTTRFDAAEYLDSEERQVAYMTTALETGDADFVRDALGLVARARGMGEVARNAGLNCESLYKALGDTGNPELRTVMRVRLGLWASRSQFTGLWWRARRRSVVWRSWKFRLRLACRQPCPHLLPRSDDRLHDIGVAGAAANLAAELVADGGGIRARKALQDVARRDQHARRAEAALQGVALDGSAGAAGP